MTHSFTADKRTFWITHSEDALEHGIIDAGESVSTGLSYLETYTSPRQWNARLVLLRKNYTRAVDEWLEAERLRDPYAHLADYRWKKETGGITLSSGIYFQTTRESQAQLTSTITALTEGMVQEPIQWKTGNGWMPLTEAQLRLAATEVATHVKKCFQTEEIVDEQIKDDPTIDVEVAFDAAYAGL